ncbi:MAG: hypothetical protein EB080_05125, partial [Burkholderiaceae bacterium]|nr:hypothetical protein [Burkholderiaceae bacterium]
MSTLNDMVSEIKSNLQGYTLRQDRISYVANAAGLTTTSSSITIGSAANLAKGTIEIDDELIFIDSFDKATNRVSIKKAINDTINALYPNLWAISSYTFTFNASVTTYALPDDCEDVLYVSWQTTGSSQEWLPLKRWRLDGMASSAAFNSNSTLNIYDNVQPGRTVQVWYTTT